MAEMGTYPLVGWSMGYMYHLVFFKASSWVDFPRCIAAQGAESWRNCGLCLPRISAKLGLKC